MIEQRRHARAPIHAPLSFIVKGNEEQHAGLGKDISLGGMFIETDSPATFGAEVIIHVELPGAGSPFALPGIVRWVRADGMGVQFGLLGARETYVITEIKRRHTESGR